MQGFDGYTKSVSKFTIILIAVLLTALTCVPATFGRDVKPAVVKIFTIQTRPDYDNPWDRGNPESVSGSGCVIDGNRVLTNAHVVSDQTFIQVRRYSESKKYKARVIAVSHEVDLALLSVDDSAFFKGIRSIPLGKLPDIQDEVLVYGFPEGGDTLSITKGVISRIEHQRYVHSLKRFLSIQIDAAINAGNSGGPVISKGAIVGVVMQRLQDSENISYIVPTTIIKHFLADLKDGRLDGVPSAGVFIQAMENRGLREMHGLKENDTGVLVYAVMPDSPALGVIRARDVILSIDGHRIANDGTVAFKTGQRTSANYYIQTHQFGEKVEMEVLRNGKKRNVGIILNRVVNDLVPRERYDRQPTYYIYGGLVFIPLTKNYLETWGDRWASKAPDDLVSLFLYTDPSVAGEEIIVMSKVLPHEVNNGFHDVADRVITAVNGKKVNHLKEMIHVIESDGDAPYVEFNTKKGGFFVLNREVADRAKAEILATYGVPSDRSFDLKP
jgi:S1-C subfamily serine protease